MTRNFGREEQKAIFASLKDKKSVRVGILKPLNSNERRASEFTVIPLGSANPEHENFGLPTFTIPRADALRIRKENFFDVESSRFGSTSHIGNFPVTELKRLSVKDPKAFVAGRIKPDQRQSEDKPLPKEKEGTSEDPHQIPQTALNQLLASKVNGFPFFKFTGIKGFLLEGNDTLTLKDIPRNPNRIKRVKVVFDQGQDLYNLVFFKEKNNISFVSKRENGVFFDQMAEIIAREMGVL
jgi:hypothetical protein